MGRYRKIYTRIWNDKKFNELSDSGKLAFFLLLTHPHLMPIGAMRATLAGLASELRWPFHRFKKAFFEIISKNMLRYDEAAFLLWWPNFIKYNMPESPNVIKSWKQHLDYLPECNLKNEAIDSLKVCVETMPHAFREALRYVFAKGSVNQEQEQEQKQEEKTLSGKPDVMCEKDILKLNKTDFQMSNSEQRSSLQSQAKEVLYFLNKKTGKNFRVSDSNINLIVARLRSGVTVMDCRGVIAKKYRDWKGDKKTAEWLRPKTLFNAINFDQYLGELVFPKEDNDKTVE